MTLVSGNIKVHADIRGGPLGGASNESGGLLTTAIFGNFFGNFRDKASNII